MAVTTSQLSTYSTHWYDRFTPRTLAGRRTLVGYVFIAPFILGFLLWFLIPAAVAGWLTFHDWNLLTPPKYVGLANLQSLFKILARIQPDFSEESQLIRLTPGLIRFNLCRFESTDSSKNCFFT